MLKKTAVLNTHVTMTMTLDGKN